MSNMVSIKGTLEHIVYRNDENGYTVAILEDSESNREVTVVGYFSMIAEGELLRIRGQYVNDPMYGKQFKAKSYNKVIPTSAQQTRKLLSGGLFKGIGPITASQIVDMFGDDTMKVIESRSSRLLDVPGVGKKTARKIWDSLDTYSGKMDIIQWMVNYGFSSGMVRRIVKWFNDNSIEKLRENPYTLTYIRGIGFIKADAFARWIGFDLYSTKRVAAGLYYTLVSDENGNTYLKHEQLHKKTEQLLGINITDEQMQDALSELLAKKRVEVKPWGVHARDLYYAERNIASVMIELSYKRTLHSESDMQRLDSIIDSYAGSSQLNTRQRLAVVRSVIEGVSIITGGPGTGKTFTIGAIIHVYRLLGKSITLCAPTGRAAKRMTESTQYPAATIHRTLEFSPHASDSDTNGGMFNYNSFNKLDTDLVIVDEVSMVDVRLMSALLDAIDTERTSLVMVGDENQLPSIGPGNILKDTIRSDKVAFTRLIELYRQVEDSLIVKNAIKVNSGDVNLDKGGRDKDFIWHTDVSPDLVVKAVTAFIPKVYGIDPKDTIVLSPIRKSGGALNVNNLNAKLQSVLNPDGDKVPSDKADLRIGDRVIHNKNDYEKDVYNGDLGVVKSIIPGSTDSKGAFVVDYYGVDVVYSTSDIDQIELANAISIHRSQGGEYDAVVIVLPDVFAARRLLSRNLLYTAITRSKKLCILLGSEDIVKGAIQNNVVYLRNTILNDELEKQFRLFRKKKGNINGWDK